MSSDKHALFHELTEEIRRSQAATDRFDQAVADAVGLHRTDLRCIDVLDREGPVTAGRLAEATGLTSGAMTAALDRLERGGWARRVRDERDRRRVLVEAGPEAQRLMPFYEPHARIAAEVLDRYTAEELELLRDFVRRSREFNEEQAAAVEAETRGRDARTARR